MLLAENVFSSGPRVISLFSNSERVANPVAPRLALLYRALLCLALALLCSTIVAWIGSFLHLPRPAGVSRAYSRPRLCTAVLLEPIAGYPEPG